MISGGFRTPMRKPTPACGASNVPPLPPELEARIAALEAAPPRADFDRRSWLWMILFGIAIPAGLLAVGWWIVPGNR